MCLYFEAFKTLDCYENVTSTYRPVQSANAGETSTYSAFAHAAAAAAILDGSFVSCRMMTPPPRVTSANAMEATEGYQPVGTSTSTSYSAADQL